MKATFLVNVMIYKNDSNTPQIYMYTCIMWSATAKIYIKGGPNYRNCLRLIMSTLSFSLE